MSGATSCRSRGAALLALLVVFPLAALLGTPSAASGRQASLPSPEGTERVLRPEAVPMSAAELPGPGRGQLKWQGIAPEPAGWPTSDVYYRDQVYWGRIEKQRGHYDFSTFDAGLADAAAHGGRLDFRVMAWCPGCWMEYSTDPNKPPATPRWLPRQAGQWRPPQWNSEAFLSAWEDLMAALGRRYADDPRLGRIDIGGYGAYGEWHVTEGQRITVANAVRVARAVQRAFPDQTLLVNAMDPALVLPVLRLSPQIGWRHDCLGADFFGWMSAYYPLIRDRWKTAPVVSEWCHSTETTMARGLRQVRDHHVSATSSSNMPIAYPQMSAAEQAAFRAAAKQAGYRYQVDRVVVPERIDVGDPVPVRVTWDNVGSAPTYDRWSVRLGLADRSTGAVRSIAALPMDLRQVLPGSRAVERDVTFATRVPSGAYTLVLQVRDAADYSAPMRLPIRDRRAGGWYRVGQVAVG